MKICYFKLTILEQGGGVENYYTESARYFSNQDDVQCDIVTLDNNFTEKLENILSIYYLKKKSIKTAESTDSISKKIFPGKYFKSQNKKNLIELLNSYDLIYVKNEIIEAMYLKYIIGYSKIPKVIFGVHTPLLYPSTNSLQSKLHNFLYGSIIYKNLTKKAAAFHTLNSFDEKNVKKLHTSPIIETISNPFDGEKFRLTKPNSSYNLKIKEDKINIAWVGRLTEQKGIDTLIQLIKNIDANVQIRNKVSWNIVGHGDYSDEIKKLSSKISSVNFHGYIEHQNIPYFLNQNDIFLSTSKWEGYPYNILEALSVGLTVFSFDIPGCADILNNYKTGIISTSDEDLLKNITNELIEKSHQDYSNKNIIKIETPENTYNLLKNFFKKIIN